ncbi:hypothetical protein MBCUT_07660 [Methanobrevibacter cuticularis]|uniref:Uncharacterized protein n=1 Tax=Methanobrevibacter cuticularis TaxID=47311 RepID=A0A166EDE4_9EURY|nr:hypothetical protein [Methanobrevibacter cuticularis]KZX16532.1 hypothetical protein MBCUT_07660 [Methanobrevibacter cuticularis]
MNFGKFSAVIVSLLLFVDLFLLIFLLFRFDLYSRFFSDYKLLIRAIVFIGGAYMAGTFYHYLKGDLDNENYNELDQLDNFKMNKNKVIAIGIVVLIFIACVVCIFYL